MSIISGGITGLIRSWWWRRVLGHSKPPGYGVWFRLRLRKHVEP
jgi:hypothetical protein